MKACSLTEFMQELKPWLDKDHIKSASLDQNGHMTLFFMDGMKNVYDITDCNREQITAALKDLKKQGIPVSD